MINEMKKLPELNGSSNQISLAENIRAKIHGELLPLRGRIQDAIDNPNPANDLALQKGIDVIDGVLSETSASWWIDHRDAINNRWIKNVEDKVFPGSPGRKQGENKMEQKEIKKYRIRLIQDILTDVETTWLDSAGGLTWAASDVFAFANIVIKEIEENTFDPEKYKDILFDLSAIEQDIYYCALEEPPNKGKESKMKDEYHDMQELYEHRNELFSALAMHHKAWKSRKNADGSSEDGWFVGGIELKTGQITYHLPEHMWSNFPGREKEIAPWDGASPEDVLERLRNLHINFRSFLKQFFN